MNLRQLVRICTLEAVASEGNLWLAAARARKGKSRRPDVEDWWLRRESELTRIRHELLSGEWQPGGYRYFEIQEPKRRMIAAAPFRDRVVHHALCMVLGPVLERRFIARSFSCQVGKGTTAARECCRQLVNRHSHVLKCDVAKFFPSISHELLLAKLARVIRCSGALELCRRIVASHGEGGCGLPIGNLTSQLWGNFFLDEMDHWLTEARGHGAYVRYTDDFLLFGEAPALHALRGEVAGQLAALRLRLAVPKSRVLATREGVPFCGFRFLPGLRPRVLGGTKRRFTRRRSRLLRLRRIRQLSVAVAAWYAFSREGNSAGLRRAWRRGPGRVVDAA